MTDTYKRHDVGCELVFEVTEASLLAIQVAPATTAGEIIEERLEITGSWGAELASPIEIMADHGGRIHLVWAPPGTLSFRYAAGLRAYGPLSGGSDGEPLANLEAIIGLRQSRYCPSDALAGFATTEFAESVGGSAHDVAQKIASWVFERFAYIAGSSVSLDTAIDTLLSGSGVCRDFAQLTITLCRAIGVPARLAAVYAPGLLPMDFHAVVEVLTPDGWMVIDPTRLAPRGALVRIATGRDAADTAFATTLRGSSELIASRVFASSEGDLPLDDHTQSVSLA